MKGGVGVGIYLRKSLKAGPFRFNISSSGVGVSAGVPGFRVGTGPRGNYVSVGTHGVFYRTSLDFPKTAHAANVSRTPQQPMPLPISDAVAMNDLGGASAEQLVPTGSDDLVEQLNAAASKVPIAPWVAATLGILGLTALPFGLIAWLVAIPLVYWLHQWDQGRRNAVVFYDVEAAPASWFEQLVAGLGVLASSSGKWRVDAQGALVTTHQRKTNAGAGSLVNRHPIALAFDTPKHLVTNVVVPTVTSGRNAICFLPDRLLVRSGKRFSDVGYEHIDVQMWSTQFVESARPPSDGLQVDTTWRYVNVKGGPDRRYRDNRQLPVMRYDYLHLVSPAGLSWQLQYSLPGAGEPTAAAISSAPNLPKLG